MAPTIRELLETVEARLGETIEAFTVLRTINENCNKEVNPNLFTTINARAGFWRPVTVGLQTTVITGIIAILDKGSAESATLYLVLKRLSTKSPSSIPAGIENDLDTIHNRYKTFRHKLFGHNDINREAIVDDFDKAGFTWASIANDLDQLEYAMKSLWHIRTGEAAPDRSSAKEMVYPYSLSVVRTQEHTAAFLASINT